MKIVFDIIKSREMILWQANIQRKNPSIQAVQIKC